MPTYTPTHLRSGAILQGGIPKERAVPPGPMHGLVRGVVTAVYCVDDEQHPIAQAGGTPTSVYVDVLVYGTQSGGSRFFFIPGAAVMQPFGGLHKGAVYKPRATTRLVSGAPLNEITPQSVGEMDGDHVVLSMLDGRSNQAVVIGHLPHPSRDVGNPATLSAGQRQQLRVADGDPFFLSHHGSTFGLDDAGNFVVDTTRATANGLAPNSGDAPGSPGNGSFVWALAGAASRTTEFRSAGQAIMAEHLSASGYTLDSKLAPMSYQLTSAVGNGLKVTGGGPLAKMQVGDGSAHAAIAEQIALLWATLQAWGTSHVHLVAGAAPGTTSPPLAPAPPYNPAISSNSVSIPAV